MKPKPCIFPKPNYLFRTAIEAEILFAVCLNKKQALTGGKSLACEDKYSKKIGAVLVQQADRRSFEASAMPVFVYFYIIMIVHKCQQSAAQSCLGTFELRVLPFGKTSGIKLLNLLSNSTDRTFENRRSRYKELGKKVPQAYRVYVEDTFLPCDAGDARIFSKEVIHDGLGRISYTAKEGEVYIDGTADSTQTGWNISSAINYDEAGRKIEEGMPFFYGGDLEQELSSKNSYQALEAFYELNNFTTIRNGTKYEYDDIDRNILTTLPDGHKQKTEYSIESSLQITKTTDPLENVSISKKDARGNIREVERLDKNNTLLTKARYEYSVLGEMLKAYDAKDNLLAVNYDMLGRRISLESLDMGRKEWNYDDKGRLEYESDSVLRSKLASIKYEYDGLDRIIKIDYPFSEDVEYEYGPPGDKGAGEIIRKKDETGETMYSYGQLNEVKVETRTIKRGREFQKPVTAVFNYEADYLGRMQSISYPDGEVLTYSYDKGGQLKGVIGTKGIETYKYVDNILYDEHSQRVYIKYGNGVETRYTYDPARRWLKDIKTENKDKNLVFQKINYNFDAVGNVEGYTNTSSKYETSQNYSYDALYQLIKAEGTHKQYGGINPNPDNPHPSTPLHTNKYRQTFAFDIIGNMTNKSSTTNLPGGSIGTTDDTKLNYELDYEYDSKYAHRLIRAGTRYYRYDANGNITAEKDGPFTEKEDFTFTYSYFAEHDVYGVDYGFDLEPPEDDPANLEVGTTTGGGIQGGYRRDYTWNERNLLIKSDDKLNTVIYRYGDDGQRALKFTQQSNSETLYFNNFYSVHQVAHEPNHEHGLRVSKHIFVGNSRLVTAMTHADNNGDTTEQTEKRYYYHADHLQSAQFITNARGEQYEHIEYTPYGELWIEETAPGIDKLPFRFTGKELDEETGLYYYGARYLDPKYSRWLSGDPALNDYIPKAPIDDEAKKHNENLPGMGGVFNTVNLHVYHYAGNNPVKYTDPTGKFFIIDDLIGAVIQSIRDNNWSNFGEKFKSNFINTWKLIGHSIAMLPQTLWFAPQEILGLLLGYGCILGSGGTVDWDGGFTYVNMTDSSWDERGITLGSIGIGDPDVKSHEKGHYYQSWILGPLYLFVIGIPSGIHAALHNTNKCNRCNELYGNGDEKAYKHFWTEQWAEKYNKEKNKEEKK
ncbi:RHS repeat-associated core domain-containing protein [Treponema sp. OMZ 792]|uniref:RHS repeat-associated core domain-containing protein n=1 Tax=unclassified Treponema TaxID=2638727 RepID=UPI0020A54118|nr:MULTISPECIES: RHS repeat-associated core domain-containing protein [unclassified Treponema]UTC75805.1 RHS repeat-associated core domain-containing protein [Treponema sp. OMZ 792]UTC79805.1 RHS repeat-associated core domain-containing protein [Treponema sp. OMZ 798]